MAKAPANTEQQTQEKFLPRQEVTVETSVLQTPTNEERTRKRDREEETPLTTSTNQQGEKRQRLNPSPKEEVPIRPSMGMGPPSAEASASSFQQEQERQHGGEVSSSRQQTRFEPCIKKQFMEIKERNEPLRFQLYNQLLKMAQQINKGSWQPMIFQKKK